MLLDKLRSRFMHSKEALKVIVETFLEVDSHNMCKCVLFYVVDGNATSILVEILQ